MTRLPVARMPMAALAAMALTACSSTYYKALETFGVEKRDVLVTRVEAAKDAQENAQEQFRDALEQFQALVGYDGGDLEKMYDNLSDEYESSVSRADAVHDRLSSVKKVGEDLFGEWEDELDEYSDPNLRRKSQSQMNDTRRDYDSLVRKMEKAAGRMDPVLTTMNDHVLFLKHNLNARALGSLEDTADTLQRDVNRLIKDMEAAIFEADRFVTAMSGD
jgi:Skp family chaperone for outer membrane proteins